MPAKEFRYVVKVQRPISGDMRYLLAYSQGQEYQDRIPVASEIGSVLVQSMGSKMRAYFLMSLVRDEFGIIGANFVVPPIADQGW